MRGQLCLVKSVFLSENVDVLTHFHLSNNILDHMSEELVKRKTPVMSLNVFS